MFPAGIILLVIGAITGLYALISGGGDADQLGEKIAAATIAGVCLTPAAIFLVGANIIDILKERR